MCGIEADGHKSEGAATFFDGATITAVDEGSLTGADLNSDIFVKCIVFLP